MTDIVFPAMSTEDGATGVVSTWYVEDGEQVEADTLLAEVAMDKINAEVLAPAAGTITLLVAEEQEVPQGSVIATLA